MSRLADHYSAVRERNGYDLVSAVEGTDLDWLAGLERRFVAVDGRETVAAALDRPTLVCAGVGMTGPPHLGTVGQVLTAIELQAAGLDVQFVLADLEPYHAGADWDRVRTLAERYRAFALDLGFDPDRGALRTQSEAREVMATGHRLARYYAPEAWDDGVEYGETDWRQAVEDLYDAGADDGDESNGGPSSGAADAHSAVLHGADFLHPLAEEGYDQVVIALGIDEHGLTPWTRRFRDAAPVSGAVAGLHTRLVPGFGDVPKMSKSVAAGVSLDASPEAVRERVATAPDGEGPAESTAFQAMCLASRYGSGDLARLEAACEAGGEEWAAARRAYADFVAGLAERWRATAERGPATG